MEKISKLAKLFGKKNGYKIYPKCCYDNCTLVRRFQKSFPEDHYSKGLKTFLYYQKYKPTQRGADLPWWGEDFFGAKKACRVMVIGQDTAVKDVGSIVLEAQFFPDRFDEVINKIINKFGIDIGRRKRIKDQFVRKANYQERLEKATNLIKKEISRCRRKLKKSKN